jgi:linoleoyl-CoA desaturase
LNDYLCSTLKNISLPKFKSSAGSNFYFELKQNVENYFRTNGISKNANYKTVIKTIVLLGSYFGCYVLLLTLAMPVWTMWALTFVMGLAVAGIGMGVMHDANHGSYSKNKLVNKVLGRTADILGANSNNWVNQHNKLHHTYTNIYEHDEDINGKGLFRFTPEAPVKWFHRFQQYYWVLFYSFLVIGWFFADFTAYRKYREKGLNKSQGKKKYMEVFELIFFKLVFVGYMVVIPYLVLDLAFWQVLVGFLTVELTSGLILSTIFSMAHVVDKFDLSNHDKFTGETKVEWAVHQIHNTFNFATKNKIVTWYCGGLNYQIEHHLFPNICHIHYPKLYTIIKATAIKHGVNYQEFDTFWEALGSHVLFLKKLGRPIPAYS